MPLVSHRPGPHEREIVSMMEMDLLALNFTFASETASCMGCFQIALPFNGQPILCSISRIRIRCAYFKTSCIVSSYHPKHVSSSSFLYVLRGAQVLVDEGREEWDSVNQEGVVESAQEML